VHSSATMVFATLNLPCVRQSKPVASPVRSSSCAGDLQIGQRRGLGNGLLRRRRTNLVYLGTTTFWKNSRASITASVPNRWLKPYRFRPTRLCLVLCAVESVAYGVQMTRVAQTTKAPRACTVARSVIGAGASSASPRVHCNARILSSDEIDTHSAHTEHDPCCNDCGYDRTADHEPVGKRLADAMRHNDRTSASREMREDEERAEPIMR
jgi:hypothetical protein